MTKETAVAALFKVAQAIPHLLAPDETHEQWDERVHMIVEENYEAAGKFADGKGWTRFELASAVTVKQGNESGGFDRRVHAGEVHPVWTQDKGLARCLGQLHETKDQRGNPAGPVPRAVWDKIAGLDLESTALCAHVTTAVLVSHAKQCGVFLGRRASRQLVAQAFASYAYGGKCVPEEREWKQALQWETLMMKFGPAPDLLGYHCVPLGSVPEDVRKQAQELVALMAVGWEQSGGRRIYPKVGETYSTNPNGDFKMRLERHAEGKVGVSVFALDESK